MESQTRPVVRAMLASLFRRIGIGVAGAELIYLLWWIGVDTGVIPQASIAPPGMGGASLGSLAGLGLGMAWAAAGGLLVGLAASAGLACRAARPVRQPDDQDRANALVERNQSR